MTPIWNTLGSSAPSHNLDGSRSVEVAPPQLMSTSWREFSSECALQEEPFIISAESERMRSRKFPGRPAKVGWQHNLLSRSKTRFKTSESDDYLRWREQASDFEVRIQALVIFNHSFSYCTARVFLSMQVTRNNVSVMRHVNLLVVLMWNGTFLSIMSLP